MYTRNKQVRIGIDSRLQARGIENLFSEIIAENIGNTMGI
jgi:hypothetical protein